MITVVWTNKKKPHKKMYKPRLGNVWWRKEDCEKKNCCLKVLAVQRKALKDTLRKKKKDNNINAKSKHLSIVCRLL